MLMLREELNFISASQLTSTLNLGSGVLSLKPHIPLTQTDKSNDNALSLSDNIATALQC